MSVRVLIRSDASLAIGTGHVMRCLCLARGLADRGADVQFACRELEGNLIDAIRSRGFPVHALDAPAGDWLPPESPPHAHWLEADPAQDADETLGIMESLGDVDVLIVDHYALDVEWEARLRSSAKRILVVDELADRAHDADLLLDHTVLDPEIAHEKHVVPAGCGLLLGPRYAPLRPEFAAARRNRPRREGGVRRLFVFLGGVDAGGFTLRALDALARVRSPVEHVDVLIGSGNVHAEAIAARCREHARFHLHHASDDLAGLMSVADFAIGAGGFNTWERACLGLPALILVVADNQRAGADAMVAAGAALALDGGKANAETIASIIDALTADQLASMSERARDLVDGRGTDRILRVLLPPGVTLRTATEADRETVGDWRNEPGVRAASKDPRPIPPAQHERWFAEALADPSRSLLIAEDAGKSVGVLRYDCNGTGARISIYLAPGCSGRGYGPAILRRGSQWLRNNRPDMQQVVAEILPGNAASRHAFIEAGFIRDGGMYIQELQS